MIGTVVLLFTLAYWQLPWLATRLQPWVVERLQLSRLEYQLERPGTRTARLTDVLVEGPGFRLSVDRLSVDFDWRDLISGNLAALDVNRAEVEVDLLVEQEAGGGASDFTWLGSLSVAELVVRIEPYNAEVWGTLRSEPSREHLEAEVTLQLEYVDDPSAVAVSINRVHLTGWFDQLNYRVAGLDLLVSDPALPQALEFSDVAGVGSFVSSTGAVDSVFSLDALSVGIVASPEESGWRIQSDVVAAASDDWIDQLLGWELEGIVLGGEKLQANADVLLGDEMIWRIRLQPVRLEGSYQSFSVDALSGDVSLAGKNAAIETMEGTLSLAAEMEAVEMDAAPISVAARLPELRFDGSLKRLDVSVEEVWLRAEGETLPQPVVLQPRDFDVEVGMEDDQLRLSGDLTWVDTEVNFSADWRGEGGAVEARLRLPRHSDWPAKYLGWADLDYVLGGESLLVDASVILGKLVSYDVQLGLNNAAIVYGDYSASGVTGELLIASDQDGLSVKSAELSIPSIATGVDLTDVRTAFSFDVEAERVQVGTVTGQVLGGRFEVPGFAYDLAAGNAALNASFADLDLAEILALEGDDVTGTGRLKGELPIDIRAEAVSISDGRLEATQPGVVRLSKEVTASLAQPGLDFALRALEDFRYDVLRATINYASNGDLEALVRLEGRNPEVESGRPFHYNLNVSENIPVLLRSLRLQDEVTRRVESRALQGKRGDG